MDYVGMTALVTGASGGLGETFAMQLARRGANLVLVARSEDRLNRLAETLRERHRVQVTVLPADLSSTEAVDGLTAEVRHRGHHVDILVNNAGLGVFEDFLDASFARQAEQVDVNVRALVSLTHAFAPGMVAARRGGIINIASTAAFQPLAGAAVYAASKAFVLFFSEGLALELEKTGVKVTAAGPGPVATRFFADKNPEAKAERMNATTSTTAAAPLMSIHEVERRIGFSHQAIYRWMNAGQFPRPIKVGPVGVRWKVDEVERWVSERRRTVEQQCSLPPPSPKPTPSTAAEDRTARVLIPRPIRDALMPAATRRRIGLHALLVSILRVVADEDMVDAVLDDMTGGGA